VDWDARRAALAALRAGAAPTDETAKLYVTWKTLELRAERAAAFAGRYEPIDLGPGVCAYTRGGEVLVAVATRRDVVPQPPQRWRDVLGLRGLVLGVPDTR
jgi:maltooligosyltrehalose synthase